jgi:DNA ligase-1
MNTKIFDTLYHKGRKGELRVWKIWTEDSEICTEYGTLGGELITARRKAAGKNKGRSNETTDIQQAQSEAQSDWQHKLDRKYSTTQEGAQDPLVLPMLAKEIDERKVIFPAFIQKKLDGNRCLVFWKNDKIMLLSRGNKEYTVPKHIREQLENYLPKDCMFDGELYVHGKSCQTIASYVKKWREIETPTVEYWIYDMPIVDGNDDLTYEERNNAISYFKSRDNSSIPNIKFLDTEIVNSMEEVKNKEAEYVVEGYEGAIVRNNSGKYLFGYRSSDLLKVKTFNDAEFEVVYCRDGVGKFEGCAVWGCKNDLNDQTFECTIASTMDEKANHYQNKDKYIGKKLTVKFFGRTDGDIPRFPVGKMFRDSKDLG